MSSCVISGASGSLFARSSASLSLIARTLLTLKSGGDDVPLM